MGHHSPRTSPVAMQTHFAGRTGTWTCLGTGSGSSSSTWPWSQIYPTGLLICPSRTYSRFIFWI